MQDWNTKTFKISGKKRGMHAAPPQSRRRRSSNTGMITQYPVQTPTRQAVTSVSHSVVSTPSRLSQRAVQSSLTWRHFLKQRWKTAIFGIVLVALLEIFIFNLPSWNTLHNTGVAQPFTAYSVTGMQETPRGWMITNPNNATLDITTSDQKIQFVHLNDVANPPQEDTVTYRIVTYFADSTTSHTLSNWLSMSSGDYRSRFINMGNCCHHMAIQFAGATNTIIPFKSITVNPKVPFQFSLARIVLMLLIVTLCLFFGPGSPLWSQQFSTHSFFQVSLLIGNTVILMILYYGMWKYSYGTVIWTGQHNVGWGWYSYDQYANLANSLLHGHTWLDLPVNHQLASLSNPYNPASRYTIAAQGGQYFWDHAYYNGHYYCYFGVIPAILFFMPYEILSGGQWLPSAYAILISVLLGAIFATLFVTRLAKTYFKDPSLGAVMFGIWMMGIGSGILYHVFTCSFYSVPEAASYMFTLAALWCWLSSIKHPGKVSIPWVFFGSFCMACNLGCRPQFIFSALLAIPIYWNAVFKDRSLFSRRGFWPTIMVILPFVLVFIPLMMYNVARFGSPLNFGNKYQLTIFDANTAQFPHSSVFSIAFYYLFQPMSLIGIFPFVSSTQMPGLLYFPLEPSEGGFFTFVAPFAIILFLAPWVYSKKRHFIIKNNFRDNNNSKYLTARHIVIFMISISCVSSFLALLADSLLGGFSQRYISDFAVVLMVAVLLVFFTCSPAKTSTPELEQSKKLFMGIIFTLVLLAFIAEFFALFMTSRYGSLLTDVPWHYFPVQSWFLFMS